MNSARTQGIEAIRMQIVRHTHASTQQSHRLRPRGLPGYVRTPNRAHGAVIASAQQQDVDYTRYTVSLKKPIGIVLEQDSSGNILVAEVKEESAAQLEGVKIGDQLIATSGVVYNKELDYAGITVKAGEEIVRMLVVGESFKTVGAAIRSHPGHVAVTLEFQRLSQS